MKKFAVLFALGIALGACTPDPDVTDQGDGRVEDGADDGTDDDVVNDEPEVDDSFPTVEGLAPAVDLDPAIDVVEYELDIGTAVVPLVSGTFTEMWTYNGTSPGPLLQARVGDTVRIHVTNNLAEPTTVHWHGLRIDYRMDGIVHGSLPAIAPGETFTYEFVVPEAGTFWYHPHMRSEVQVEAGLYGAFIVHEDDDMRPDIDNDRMFVIDDIRLEDDGQIAEHVNGGMDVMHGRTGNLLLVNGRQEQVLNLGPGQVERWRIVNTANARTFVLQFPGLEVREIGADGGLWPQSDTRVVESVYVPVGARVELEVRLAEGSEGGTVDALVPMLNEAGEVVNAPLTFIKARADDRLAVDTPRAGHTADPEFDAIGSVDVPTDVIELSGYNTGSGIVFTVNGEAWPNGRNWTVNKDTLHIIEIRNLIGPEHPFHLHGQFFQVLTRDGSPAWEKGWRDTVLIEGMSTVTIATRFENPGDWMYHCHILEHGENGMMAMVEVRD